MKKAVPPLNVSVSLSAEVQNRILEAYFAADKEGKSERPTSPPPPPEKHCPHCGQPL